MRYIFFRFEKHHEYLIFIYATNSFLGNSESTVWFAVQACSLSSSLRRATLRIIIIYNNYIPPQPQPYQANKQGREKEKTFTKERSSQGQRTSLPFRIP